MAHPDNAARQLTLDEIQTIHTHAKQWIKSNDAMVGQWQNQLPVLPRHPDVRRLWAAGLPERERVMYEDLEAMRAHMRPVESALRRGDYRLLLDLLTQAQTGDEERAVRKDLYDIRDAFERRLGDAVTAAIADVRV